MRQSRLTFFALCCCLTTMALHVGLMNNRGNYSQPILDELKKKQLYDIQLITDITSENLAKLDVLILQRSFKTSRKKVIRDRVKAGMGILLTHDATGAGRHLDHGGGGVFPELIRKPLENSVIMSPRHYFRSVRKHPLTQNVENFKQPFSDYIVYAPLDDGMVLMEDYIEEDADSKALFKNLFTNQSRWLLYKPSHPVMIAGRHGTGRVVLYGGLMGLNVSEKVVPLCEGEAQILHNAISWLAGKTPYDITLTGKTGRYPAQSYDYPNINFSGRTTVQGDLLPLRAVKDSGSWQLTLAQQPAPQTYYQITAPLALPDGLVTVTLFENKSNLQSQVQGAIKDGKLSFIAKLSQQQVLLRLSAPKLEQLLTVRQMPRSSLAEVTGPTFRLILAQENRQPSLVSLQLFDPGEHHTWDGLESNSLSAPLMRLANAYWPFRAVPRNMQHERGKALPIFTDSKKFFANQATVKVGNGTVTVYPHGLVTIKNICTQGRMATWGFDHYLLGTKNIKERFSPDMPACSAEPLWAVKPGRYAIGGNLELQSPVGATGMTPGIVRKFVLKGDRLMLNTVADGNLCQIKNLPQELSGTLIKVQTQPALQPQTTVLAPRSLNLYSLLEKRGKPDFLPSRPGVIEIFASEVPQALAISRWQLRNSPSHRISCDWSQGSLSLTDDLVRQAMDTLDPLKEEKEIYRRFYLRPLKQGQIGENQLELVGLDDDSTPLLRLTLNVRDRISIPRGFFIYYSQWETWHQETPDEQYYKIFRDLHLADVDYAIAQINEHGTQLETSDRLAKRLQRHGILWMAGLNHIWGSWASRLPNSSYEQPDIAVPAQKMKDAVQRFLKTPNLWAYYLSDEVASGIPKDGRLPTCYLAANMEYDLVKSLDPKRPAMHLISPHFTTYETAVKYLKTDWISWDRYVIGAPGILSDLKRMRALTGPDRILCETLRAGGPFWYDTIHHYMDIRQQAATALLGGADAINYYKYMQQRHAMTWRNYGVITMAEKGVVATPRRQSIQYICDDVAEAITVEYLIDRQPSEKARAYRSRLDKALHCGMKGQFHAMHQLLADMYRELHP